jgi:hypothetical protein
VLLVAAAMAVAGCGADSSVESEFIDRVATLDKKANDLQPLADRFIKHGVGGDEFANGVERVNRGFKDLLVDVETARPAVLEGDRRVFWDAFTQSLRFLIEAQRTLVHAIRTNDQAEANRVPAISERAQRARDEANAAWKRLH